MMAREASGDRIGSADYRGNYKAAPARPPAARCITRARDAKTGIRVQSISRDNHRHVTAARPAPFLRALRGPNPAEEAP